ncbi:hypothetical protein AJ85_09935 [Alkalihalobacillus alcalophilus ATCC 27647 = CGMCC 1.3604]|uniref:ABC transporter permease n=3 Tax=Alkalihalobacillus alcalophilus TaxID=1445 RepID=A0A4S4JZ59_ALKAL|nr:ABC transporter permease subunit [Alkalihalobacillus alcalophilus]MED1563098.1 ABC transporter permease subunit [Alkalihalobacillus alcalophilus]THG90578.1 hypothetical protein AJ85_09935 [Alkalihalobacillus alcalophilus ATCC 27647 = CGMCC 1.3604]
MNKHLIAFEVKKFAKRRKNLVIISLLFISIFLIFVLLNGLQSGETDTKIMNYEHNISSIKQSLENLPGDDTPELNSIRESYNEELDLLESQINAIRNDDWRKQLAIQIQLDENIIHDINSEKVIGGEPVHIIEARIIQNQELINLDIEPVHPIIETEGIHFAKNIVGLTTSVLGFIIIIFIMGDTLSVEFERRTINLLLTQPISRSSLLLSKTLIAIIFPAIIICLICLLSIFLGVIFGGGMGALNYPLPYFSIEEISVISISKQIIYSSTLFLFLIIFTVLLNNLIALLTDSNIMSLGLSVIIAVSFNLAVTQYGLLSSIAHVLPFTYLNSSAVIDGTIGVMTGNANVNFLTGLIILIAYSVIIYLFSLYLLNKKQFTN